MPYEDYNEVTLGTSTNFDTLVYSAETYCYSVECSNLQSSSSRGSYPSSLAGLRNSNLSLQVIVASLCKSCEHMRRRLRK